MPDRASQSLPTLAEAPPPEPRTATVTRRAPGEASAGEAPNGSAGPRFEFSGAQRAVWEGRERWTERLHAKWQTVLSRADCEEVVVDAILSSALLRRHDRADADVVRQWWALDVKSVAVRRDRRLRGAVKSDGTRRGHHAPLETVVGGQDSSTVAEPEADAALEPAALITEGDDGESRRYRREQATKLCDTAIGQLKPKHQEVLRTHMESAGEPQRVVCGRLGLTEKAYQARLVVAKKQFARRVRAQLAGSTCEQVRVLLNGPLGNHVARVEAHLEDCYACRAWQLFHREQAVAAVLPMALVTRWHTGLDRVRVPATKALPLSEAAAAHGDATFGAGLAGGLLAGCGVKATSMACAAAITSILAVGASPPAHRNTKPVKAAKAAPAARHRPAHQAVAFPHPRAVALPRPVTVAHQHRTDNVKPPAPSLAVTVRPTVAPARRPVEAPARAPAPAPAPAPVEFVMEAAGPSSKTVVAPQVRSSSVSVAENEFSAESSP